MLSLSDIYVAGFLVDTRGSLAQARVRDIAQLGARLCNGMECRVLDIRSSIDVADEAEPKGEAGEDHWSKAKWLTPAILRYIVIFDALRDIKIKASVTWRAYILTF